MSSSLVKRVSSLACAVAALAGASLTTSCGGGGGFAARQMVLVEFLFVDRALNPTAPTGAQSLPRNAQLLMKFSEQVNAATVTNQTIQIRHGNNQVPVGAFTVNGADVRFDPTLTNQGQPNPMGFEAVTQFTVYIPSYEDDQGDSQIAGVVENRDFDPNTTAFRTAFETGTGWLRELQPPQVLGVTFVPDVDPLTGNTPGNGQMVFQFSEAMDPASFVLGPPLFQSPLPLSTTIDVRYDPGEQVNIDGLLAGNSVSGYFIFDASLTKAIFTPTFSFGNNKFVFYGQVLQGLKDLSGNLLVNPRTFGNFICDGLGRAPGKTLQENFLNTTDRDTAPAPTDPPFDAIWGTTTQGVLEGQPVANRLQGVYGFRETVGGPTSVMIVGPGGACSPLSSRGQYAAIADPLTGAALNQFVTGINPPTNQGRRVMLAFSDVELGSSGTITACHWGPDSNATFAALYQNIFLRMGYQGADSMNLSTTFSGNYESGTATVLFQGDYPVPQRANVGNTPGQPPWGNIDCGPYQNNPGCQAPPGGNPVGRWNQPLATFTGFQAWPALTTYFEWTEGVEATANDSVLLFDMSVPEGDTWQQFRTWFGATFPCSGVLIFGYPQRRLYSTYESDTANPTANFAAGILNPEPTVYDTAFTITKRRSVGQTLFYTPPIAPGPPGVGWAGPTSANGTTFGQVTNYLPVQLSPAFQAGGAQVRILFQGADLVQANRRTIDVSQPFNPTFTTDIDDCDGMRFIRWRIELISNLISSTTAKITQVLIPMIPL
jgi:hypothetical protein